MDRRKSYRRYLEDEDENISRSSKWRRVKEMCVVNSDSVSKRIQNRVSIPLN